MTQIQAQNTNLQQIEKTINYYFDAMVTHNVESLEKAFQPDASMKWIEGGKYLEVNALQALGEYLSTNKKVDTKTSILSINYSGDAANVHLQLEYDTFSYFDFMHLLKINGEWKIVSKTYSQVNK